MGQGEDACDRCGGALDETWGTCERCDDDSSTSYCCGQIYEEGELVCASCGDPL